MNTAIETKVTVGTVTSVVTAFVLWILSTYIFGPVGVPGPVQAMVVLAVTAGVNFAAMWVTPHTDRTVTAKHKAE